MDPGGWRCDKHIDPVHLPHFHLWPDLALRFAPPPLSTHASFGPAGSAACTVLLAHLICVGFPPHRYLPSNWPINMKDDGAKVAPVVFLKCHSGLPDAFPIIGESRWQ